MIQKNESGVAGKIILGISALVLFGQVLMAQEKSGGEQTRVKILLGNKRAAAARTVQLKAGSEKVTVAGLQLRQAEGNDQLKDNTALLQCGGGDVDVLLATIQWAKPIEPLRVIQPYEEKYPLKNDATWAMLIEKGAPGQSARLKKDVWFKPDAALLTILLNEKGTEGFTIDMDQLVEHKAMWLPEQDVYITLDSKPVAFKKHLASLKGKRVLDQVAQQPEADLKSFQQKWADIGDPYKYDDYWQTNWKGTRGHLTVTAASHGSVYKIAMDRWGNVRPDFASPYKFGLDLNWKDAKWKRQHIEKGLPVLHTLLEKNGQQLQIEQFVAPLMELSTAIRGYVPSVHYSKVQFSGQAGDFELQILFNNEQKSRDMEAVQEKGNWLLKDKQTGNILLLLEAGNGLQVKPEKLSAGKDGNRLQLTVTGSVSGSGKAELVVKLPTPSLAAVELGRIQQTDFTTAKKKVVDYWEGWLAKGAQFSVPEEAVNNLYRANLWHSLILPRHTFDIDGKDHMDLPYANTAYGQRNADWPINQSVYVDYMVYGLRGYDEVAGDEYQAMFKSQLMKDGRITGYGNWGVYSPGQLYAIAQNYLLSRNHALFESLLPGAMKTLDYCLEKVEKAKNGTGLVLAPLNDLTDAEREWAFNQAYYVGGLTAFAKALELHKHPKAAELAATAARLREDVIAEFERSSVKSPVVQLEDGTWINYVPTDALTPRRMMEQWYPTDVDCGPLHLTRLGVLDGNHWLTTAMLHDHEDNLFLNNNGAANEPVYVQQSTAYFLRDDVKAVIRSFYSLMACGFSHEQFSPLEHRWGWPQYYGPPSTDGAWFEIYRKMLINELGDDSLIIGQAIPRKWMEQGKKIEVKNAPTYYGNLSMEMEGLNSQQEIKASLDIPSEKPVKQLLVRFRHPSGKTIKAVNVNGKTWTSFDAKKEYVSIPAASGKYTISVTY